MKYRNLILLIVVLLAVFVPLTARQFARVQLPAELSGSLNGVPYRILVPANWDGTLLVYAHGYGEVSDPNPPAVVPPIAGLQNDLLSKGYALAASRFEGSGWNVKEGMQDTIALTAAFRGMVGLPNRTIIWGRSMGGLMALGLIEKFPGLYDGAIALCPPAAGTPRRFDQALDIALAYSVAFGWRADWGTPGDLRDDLTTAQVQPYIADATSPGNLARWEFIRLVNGIPADSYYTGGRMMAMYFATVVRAELERRAGGPIAENIGRAYALTDDQADYLTGLDPTLDVDGLLAEMNGQTIYISAPNARNYVEHYLNPSGRINRPVLTMHTKGDPIATPNNESAYWETVEQAGYASMLMQVFTNGLGHCTFSKDQHLAAVDAMIYWLNTYNRPDSSFFSAPGFNLTYVPPIWLW